MKKSIQIFAMGIALMLAFTACQKESPLENEANESTVTSQHLVGVCGPVDTFSLASPLGASGLLIDQCLQAGVMVPCNTNIPWGIGEVASVNSSSGLLAIHLNGSYYIESITFKIDCRCGFTLDGNDVPVIDSNWAVITPPTASPYIEIPFPVTSCLANNCLAIGMKVSVVRLNFFNQVVPGSQVDLWPFSTNSGILAPFLPAYCNPCGSTGPGNSPC